MCPLDLSPPVGGAGVRRRGCGRRPGGRHRAADEGELGAHAQSLSHAAAARADQRRQHHARDGPCPVGRPVRGGAAPLALAPAALQLTDDAFRFSFPIGTGNLNPVSLYGTIDQRGGFVFWGRETMSSWTVLSFTKLHATLGSTATMSAVFNGNQGRHRIMSLDLTHQHVVTFSKGGHAWVRISNIGATISDWLVDQLTTAFGGYHPATQALGTITITARLS